MNNGYVKIIIAKEKETEEGAEYDITNEVKNMDAFHAGQCIATALNNLMKENKVMLASFLYHFEF